MHFDNSQIVTRLNIRRYIAILAYIIIVVVLIFSGWFNKPVWGIEKSVWILIASVLYLLYVAYAYYMSYNFFSYSDEGEKLIFKFISLRPFDDKKRAIEISKSDFGGFNFKKSFFDFKEDLILSIKVKNGLAKYPPISISSLNESQKEKLKASLNQYI